MAASCVSRPRRIAPPVGSGARRPGLIRGRACSWLLRAGLLSIMASSPAAQMQSGPGLHSAMPAGYVVVRLQPSGADVLVLGLIECPEIEGARHVSEGLNS